MTVSLQREEISPQTDTHTQEGHVKESREKMALRKPRREASEGG